MPFPKDILYVGIKGTVLALDRATGTIQWQTKLLGSDFVNLVCDDAFLYAMVQGEAFCLDLSTGEIRWHNRLKGFGTGLASLLVPGVPQPPPLLLAEQLRRDAESAAASASTSTSSPPP